MVWFSACLVFLSETAKFLKAMPSSESSHETARKLRREQTVAEKLLWRHLRGRRLCNIKFRRQFPIGPYFTDFCSIERRLIVEVDGCQHADRSADDESAQLISLRAAIAYFDSGMIRCSRELTKFLLISRNS
jgi:very-short-patch-repair endonuclease